MAMSTRPHEFENRFRVRSYELDGFAHMNRAAFLNWFEQARVDAFEAGSFSANRIQEQGWAVYTWHTWT